MLLSFGELRTKVMQACVGFIEIYQTTNLIEEQVPTLISHSHKQRHLHYKIKLKSYQYKHIFYQRPTYV